MAAGRRRDRPRRLGRRRGRRARRRPGPAHRGQGGLPRVDAGARRPAPSTTWPARTSTSPSRSGGSSAASRRPTTAASTTPAPARTSPVRAACGGRSPTGIDSFATWREVTTVFHEGVPGHHLQVAQTAYRKELLNRWQRLMCWVSGHGEGWALYAERLMDELGYLDDPGDKLGMLDGAGLPGRPGHRRHRHAPRAGDPARQPVRVPPGRDRGPRSWAWSSCASTAGWRTPFIRFEVNRYLGWPGQAPSYKVGERIWLQAREDARGPPRRRLRPQVLPPVGARPRLDRPRPAAGRAGPHLVTRLVLAARPRPGWPRCAPPGVDPEVVVSGVDESQVTTADPAALAVRAGPRSRPAAVAGAGPRRARGRLRLRARARRRGARQAAPTPTRPRTRWRAMRGRSGVLHTGHCVDRPRRPRGGPRPPPPTVHFADLDDDEIEAYVATGEPLQVAGAFTIDGLGGAFVRGHRGRPAHRGRDRPPAAARDARRGRRALGVAVA